MYQWSKVNPWPRKPWGYSGGSYPAAYEYGLLLPQRTLRTIAYLPSVKDRMALGMSKLPYWHVMDFDLASQQALDSSIVPTENFTALAQVATAALEDAAGHFRAQQFQLIDDQGNGAKFSSVGVNGENFCGTAMLPFLFKRPYPCPNMLAWLNRTTNRDIVENVVQICIYGVKDLEATGAVAPLGS